ncbi:hypothetical protein T265_04480 [Opisthorchis viverrini]|uniref:Uncharacterized protein n=1 Tax=Opisthorchis viverrini TaxID=6198 RepID=A0A074ZSJ0_OPIVI|nr:hypothetical protein T265_04480 [Opisthorchis viverrini]KER28792.1 hypothetical protein T265_04480 [Opisthorchis viverrini]
MGTGVLSTRGQTGLLSWQAGPDAPAPPHSTGQLLVPTATGHLALAEPLRRTGPTAIGGATLRPAPGKRDPMTTAGRRRTRSGSDACMNEPSACLEPVSNQDLWVLDEIHIASVQISHCKLLSADTPMTTLCGRYFHFRGGSVVHIDTLLVSESKQP